MPSYYIKYCLVNLYLILLHASLCCIVESESSDNGDYQKLIQSLDELVEVPPSLPSPPSPPSPPSTTDNSKDKLASELASLYAAEGITNRFSQMFSSKVKTPECRAKVAAHLRKYIDAIANEESLPFADKRFPYDCPQGHLDYNNLPEGVNMHTLMKTSYQPPRDEAAYIEDPKDLKLLYGILMHGSAASTVRLIETLNEGNTMFVVHVDGKENSDDAYDELMEYSNKVENVFVVPDEFRIRVNWGGFTMVNAT